MPFLYEKTIVGSPTYNSLGPATDMLLHVPAQLPLPARVAPTDFKEEIWLSLACVRVAPHPKGGEMGDGCSYVDSPPKVYICIFTLNIILY